MLTCACNAAALVFWSPENKLTVENVALGCERKGRIQMILQYEFKGCRVLFIYSYKAESQLSATHTLLFYFLNPSGHQFKLEPVHNWSEIMAIEWTHACCTQSCCHSKNPALAWGSFLFATAAAALLDPDATSGLHLQAVDTHTPCLSKLTPTRR